MKKIFAWILSCCVAMAMAGCSPQGGVSSAPSSSESSSVSAVSSETVSGEVVTVTLPASVLLGKSVDEMVATAKDEGMMEAVKNSDGSITYKMDRAEQEKRLEGMKSSLITMIGEITDNSNFTSIQKIDYNDDFSEITFTVDRTAYEGGMDSIAVWGVALPSAHYQLFTGVMPDDLKITFQMKDAKSGEIFQTLLYPQDADFMLGGEPQPSSATE